MKNKEMRERANLARRLSANGVPLNIDYTWQENVLRLRQLDPQSESRAFDLGNRASGYIVNINIQIVDNNFFISDICLELLWADTSVSLLCDPLEIGAHCGDYRFSGKMPPIERTRVLNHLLIRPKLFRPGATFQGLIVWSGMESIPDEFVHGNILPATVVVYDQFNEAYPFSVTLWTDRRRKWSPEKCKRNSRASLLSQRDPSPSLSSVGHTLNRARH